jgi:hypothetical protein
MASHGLPDGLVAAEFQPHLRGEPRAPEVRVGGHPGTGTPLAQDEAFAPQVAKANLPWARQAMRGRRDHHQRVGHEDVVFQGEVRGWHRHDVEIIAVLAQAAHDTVAIEHFQGDLDVGIALAEVAEQPGDEVLGSADDGDPEATTRQPLDRIDLLAERLPLGSYGTSSTRERKSPAVASRLSVA